MENTQQTERMQCMEVWGGNRPVQRSVALAGLNLWVFSQPQGGAEAGGDVHYISSCGSGRVTRLLLADVSGHGTRVAEIAESLRALMQRYVNYIDQTTMVRRMNERFEEWVGEGLFATALVGTFFAPTRHMTISNAGHPPPLIYYQNRGTWSALEEKGESSSPLRNTPLGALKQVPYRSFTVRLNPGDAMLWYTDSLTDLRLTNGQLLGYEGLLEFLNRRGFVPSAGFLTNFLAQVAKEFHSAPQEADDLTLMLVQCTGEGSQAPLEYRIKSMFRFFQRTVCRKSAGKDPIPWPEISVANVLGAFIPFFNRFWKPKDS